MDKIQTQDREREREANIYLRTFEQRRRAVVREHAHEENDSLRQLLSGSIVDRNAAIGNGAKFVLKGDTVRLGNAVLLLEADQHPTNPDEYVLALGIGLDPSSPFLRPADSRQIQMASHFNRGLEPRVVGATTKSRSSDRRLAR